MHLASDYLAAVLGLPTKLQRMENTEGMVTGGKSTSKAIGEVKLSGERTWCQNLKKLPTTEDKMTPDSPTCAIDADELIMRGKLELELDRAAGKKARKGSLHSDKLVSHSVKTPLDSTVVSHSSAGIALTPPALAHNYLLRPRESMKASFTGATKSSSRATKDKLLLAKVAPSLSQVPLQAAQASAAPDSEAVAFAPMELIPSCTTALNDSKFLLLVELDSAGKTGGSIESGKGPTKSGRMDDNLLAVKVPPTPPSPPPSPPPAETKRAPAPTPASVLASTLTAYPPAPANVPAPASARAAAPASALAAYTPTPASERAVAAALAPPLSGALAQLMTNIKSNKYEKPSR